jgi:hypothetical protein
MTADRLQLIYDAHNARMDEARQEMTAERMTAERMRELDLLHEARVAVYRERHELFDHLFREVVDPEKARRALDAFVRRVSSGSRDEYAEYLRRVRACPRWEEVAKHLPPTACCELFEILLWSWGGYAALRDTHTTLTGKTARNAAERLLTEIDHSAGTPGLSQNQRDTLRRLLARMVEGGRPGLSDGGKALPSRPKNETAVRTYLLNRIILHLRKHTKEPLTAAIVDLANAVLGKPGDTKPVVDVQAVRDARRRQTRE